MFRPARGRDRSAPVLGQATLSKLSASDDSAVLIAGLAGGRGPKEEFGPRCAKVRAEAAA